MTVNEKTQRTLQGVTAVLAGVLGFILFRWTPVTAKGILSYALLFAILVALVLVLSPNKGGGYWPHKPDDD